MDVARGAMNDTARALEVVFSDAGVDTLPANAYEKFAAYSHLLMLWNTHLNLTATRDPADIWRRHFAECCFAAQKLPAEIESLLDYGSGAGFPGIPFAICRPDVKVTLAEAQSRKAVFLSEVIRSLGLRAEVVNVRVEALPAELLFDAVCLRAVENMETAITIAMRRARKWLVLFTTQQMLSRDQRSASLDGRPVSWRSAIELPDSKQRLLSVGLIGGSSQDEGSTWNL